MHALRPLANPLRQNPARAPELFSQWTVVHAVHVMGLAGGKSSTCPTRRLAACGRHRHAGQRLQPFRNSGVSALGLTPPSHRSPTRPYARAWPISISRTSNPNAASCGRPAVSRGWPRARPSGSGSSRSTRRLLRTRRRRPSARRFPAAPVRTGGGAGCARRPLASASCSSCSPGP